jgi:hypothetical protein
VEWLEVYLLPLAIDYGLFTRLMLASHSLLHDGGSDLLFDGGVFAACGGCVNFR